MCGICGHFHPDRAYPVKREILEEMSRVIIHRGPDDDGCYLNGNIGMAMRRLAIIDVAGGRQPIVNEDGTVIVVFNGEIYNFRGLRAELEKYGHHFSTNSDTEVIVHGYEQWGDEVLPRLNGMFAISLWDGKQKRLLLARDRMGQKPLYWHFSINGLLWGSEAKSVLAAPWVSRRVDALALHHYLTLQYTPDPLTMFEEIHQLPAAHKLVIEQNGKPQIERWWQLSFEPKWDTGEAGIVAQARVLLQKAVERRLISEVPLGAFLSGGIDSSIIVALMAEHTSTAVKTFSIGFDERYFSETQYARQVATRYATQHHEFLFRPDDLKRVIEGVIGATDEPLADPATLPLYELARQTRRHVTVALSGDGGDETLAGYNRYILDGLLKPYAALPSWFTQHFVPSVTRWLPAPSWLPEDRNPIIGLKRLGHFSAVTSKALLVRWGSYFTHRDKLNLYTDKWRELLGNEKTANLIAAAYDQAQANGLLDSTLYADHTTYLSGDLLPKTDRMTMAHSVEARSPFLDFEWVEWTARLPLKYKVRGFQTKWLLKAAFADILPAEIVRRGKQGFSVPIGPWLRNELRDWSTELQLGNPKLDEWFRKDKIRQYLTEHHSGRFNHGKRLWALLMFSLWLEG